MSIHKKFPITSWAVENKTTIYVLTALILIIGALTYSRLPKEQFPDIVVPTILVTTINAGTSPVDVENLVTRPLEESVGVVPGLRKVHSISQAGLSQITLEFNWGTPMDYAALDVREKIDLVRLPDEATVPLLLKYDPAQDPVVRIGLSGNATLIQLRNVADDVLCPICDDDTRDSSVLCVVEESRDIVAIERTGEFRGRYHVLLGAMSPLEGIGPEQLKIRELRTRAEERLGDRFDVKDFHTQVLMDGPMPLSMLEAKIDDWVESQL